MNKESENMVKRIRIALEKECSVCEYQDGKYCSWAKKKRIGCPPCQQGDNHGK